MPQFQLLPQVPSFGEKLGEQLGFTLGGGLSQGLQQQLAAYHEQQKLQSETEKFKQQGYPEDLAKLAASATTGGQTEVLKNVLEMRQRMPSGEFDSEVLEESENVGLTPKEAVARENSRFAPQLKLYSDLNKKLRASEENDVRISELDKMNDSGQLPRGLQLWNVKSTGDLRIPFLANGVTQRFVKTINDFTVAAKDTFGARVTNYELNRFMARLPTLMNSEEGRRGIIQQMKLFNDINQIYDRNLKNVIESSGGVRKIDWDKAESKANQLTNKETKRLISEFNNIDKQLNQLEKKFPKPKTTENVLNKEAAKDILDEAKGDRELARKIARKRGYEF